MVKGITRQVILVKSPDPRLFEEAIFIVKEEALAREGKLGIYKHNGFWQCMDTQRDKIWLEDRWNNGNAPWRVW